MSISTRSRFHLGFDYYPEHWEETMWAEDLRLMSEAGVTCVRIAEFAWGRLEPEEGVYTFDWLDRFFALAEQYGIGIILGTPTAAPTPWMWQTYPGIVAIDEHGRPCSTMGRRYVCPNSPDLRRLSDAIIEQLARRYGTNPQLIGWQTDNEISGQICYCDVCVAKMRQWLRAKYTTVEAFNQANGNVFWAHEVTNWQQVILPRLGTQGKEGNPSARLEAHRFFSDCWTEFMASQTAIIRRLAPTTWTTHNLPGHQIHMDLYDLAAAHDFISIDFYPKAMIDPPTRVAFQNDITGSCQERSHWVMEVQTGTPCTKFYKAPVPRPGQLALWAHQSAAHGAEGVVFFRWRKSPVGHEMFGNGLLDHDARPRRQYGEIKELGRQFARLAETAADARAPREVAVLFDFADRALSTIHEFAIDLEYFAQLQQWWAAARRLGLNVRMARATDDLSAYRLVIAPALYTTSPAIADNLKGYVRAGGTLVGASRMGWFDVAGKPSRLTLPGGMTDLFGAEVEEYERVMEPNPNRVVFGEEVGGVSACRHWNHYCNLLGARTLGTYERDFYAGQPAVTLNAYGEGRACYVGAMLDADAQTRLMEYLAEESGLSFLPEDPTGDIEVVRLVDGQGRAVWSVLNHGPDPRAVALPHPAVDLMTGAKTHELTLPSLSAQWIRFE